MLIERFFDVFINSPVPISVEDPEDDPNDWYVYNIGLQYNCTIVSADKDLVRLKRKPFPFIHTAEFLKWL
ncbi:MAG: hypothetical protein K2X48_15645 [Chitinophagaceae bacterium]|nr:hypothetical protein [Chitinophagaceae bacterium]